MNDNLPCSDSARVLSANIERLMAAHVDLNSNTKLGKKAHVGVGTISRLRTGSVEATLGVVERIAQAFDIQPWQLLVPGMDPANPPVLRELSESESELYRRLKLVAAQIIDMGPKTGD